MYNIISLFSGAGGLDAGFLLNKNSTVQFANEIRNAPVKTYSKNFNIPVVYNEREHVPPYVLQKDIRKTDLHTVARTMKNKADILTGGPPCQDFSVLRGKSKRKGILTERGRLFLQFIRAVRAFRPKAFVFENVPGLASANNGAALQRIITALQSPGKEIEYALTFAGTVNATAAGVPQNRNRLIIIGVRKDIKCEGETTIGDPVLKKYPLTPIEVLEGKPLHRLKKRYAEIMEAYEPLAANPPSRKAKEWAHREWNQLSFDPITDYILLNKIQNSTQKEIRTAMDKHKEILQMLGYYRRPANNTEWPDGSNRIPAEKETTKQKLAVIPPGGNYMFTKGTPWEIKGLISNVYKRIHPLVPAPTVIAYGGGGTWGYHYERNRGRLTNRERARLQSFPDWFLFEGNMQEVRAQIGEAVPPLLGYAIAEQITRTVLE